MMKIIALAVGLMLPTLLSAEVYINENFANYIPAKFTLINADGGTMQSGIYSNVGNDPSASWIAGQLDNGYGRAALSPTHNSDSSLASENWMILPAVTIKDADAVIRWEARSLHTHIPESYKVMLRAGGNDNWVELYECSAESPIFTTHSIGLADYVNQQVEVAFVATTQRGFILAIDNIMVGVPDDDKFMYVNSTKHYTTNDINTSISGTLSYFGHNSAWTEARLTLSNGEVQSMTLPELHCGESYNLEFNITGGSECTYDYKISAIGADNSETLIYSDYINFSVYERVHVIDRCSGTWCNNCLTMELTTSRLNRYYGDQIVVIEAHIRDVLANNAYNAPYINDNIFGIPVLIPNHNVNKLKNNVKSNDFLRDELNLPTDLRITGSAAASANGEVRINSKVETSNSLGNTDDRYKIAYTLIGDVHDPTNPSFAQYSSVVNFTGEQYFYMPGIIKPEMMYYTNVPIDGSVSGGVPKSLPSFIAQGDTYAHDFEIHIPEYPAAENLKVVAMVIDTSTMGILNATVIPVSDASGISDVTVDLQDDIRTYDIMGRPVSSDAHGLLIRHDGSKATIILNK